MASAELTGELIAPDIKIDSKILLTPRNVSHPLVQEFLEEKGIVRVTEDNRVGLRIFRDVSLAGFNKFLFARGVDVTDANALDLEGDITPTDPNALAKHSALRMIKKALLGKDWENIPAAPPELFPEEEIVEEVKVAAVAEEPPPKLHALMLTMFTTLKQTSSLMNDYVFEPLQRLVRNTYKDASRTVIDGAFGKIDYRNDEYSRMRRRVKVQPEIKNEPILDATPNKPEPRKESGLVWSNGADIMPGLNPEVKIRTKYATDKSESPKLVPQY